MLRSAKHLDKHIFHIFLNIIDQAAWRKKIFQQRRLQLIYFSVICKQQLEVKLQDKSSKNGCSFSFGVRS